MKNYFLSLIFFVTQVSAQQPLTKMWITYHDGLLTGIDAANALILDSIGNVFVTGQSFQTTANGSITTIKYNSDGNEMWMDDFGGAETFSANKGRDLCLDPFGFILVTGDYAENEGDFCIVKYGSNGRIWGRDKEPYWFGSGEDYAREICTDEDGNIFCVASTQSMDGNLQDLYTAKYDSAGNDLWSNIYSSASGDDWATGLAVTPDGHSFPITSSYNFFGSASVDFQTLHYDPLGGQQWISSYDYNALNGEDYPMDIQCDTAYNSYVCGAGDAGSNTDMAVYMQNSYGTRLWTVTYAGSANGNDSAIAVHYFSKNLVAITGRTEELVGGNSRTAITTMLIDSGTILWTKYYYGDSLDAIPTAMTIDPDGNIYVSGYYPTASQGTDGVLLIYSPVGDLIYYDRFNSADDLDDRFNDVVVDVNHHAYVTGQSYTSNSNANYVTIKYDEALATSVSPMASTQLITVFPNPVKKGQQLLISIKNLPVETRLFLFNDEGKQVMTQSISSARSFITLKTTALDAGIYFLELSNGNSLMHGKVVVTE